MGERIDGKAIAAKTRAEVRERVARLTAAHRPPGLAVILVGDDPASQIYVRHKERACAKEGIRSVVHHVPADTPEADVLAMVDALNRDDTIDGILVQLPIPLHISTRTVIKAVDPDKDVDCFHPVNMGYITTSRPVLAPCTPRGVMRILREHDIPLEGKHAVVLGRSRVVGRPMAHLLLAANATVTVCHRHTPDSAALARQADVLVAAVGKPRLVRRDWVKPGAVVIDVGITRMPDGSLSGDVAYDEVIDVARLLSPVPGGVGPMTIAMLLANTVLLTERHLGVP